MKKIIALFLVFIALGIGVAVTSCKKEETVVIYTSTEDYNMELMQKRLNERFPNYKIEIEYMSTSNVATKVLEEGEKCEADIVYALEYGYLEKLIVNDRLADLKGEYTTNIFEKFEEDAILEGAENYIIPSMRTGGGIIINNKVLRERGIAKPTCYADLLKPEFKNLLSMPSPKASGTGYTFYLSLVNCWGEQAALNYFDGFAKNAISFTSSGSGPVNALVAGEAAVGFGMISQAAEKITSGLTDLEILVFEEGAPFGMYGAAVVKGKETKTAVMEVMDYLYADYLEESCKLFYPEPVFKGITYEVANFPANIVYSDMSGNTISRKEDLLRKWKY